MREQADHHRIAKGASDKISTAISGKNGCIDLSASCPLQPAPNKRTFHIQHSANKQYHPFRANHGFCEVRFAPMIGHRET
jgi:hypothetical protein